MADSTHDSSQGTGVGVFAVVAGGLTLTALIVTFIWISAMMAGGAGGFAIMGVMPIMGPIVLVLGIIGVIFSVVAIVRKTSTRLGVIGLLMSAAPIVVGLILLVVAMALG